MHRLTAVLLFIGCTACGPTISELRTMPPAFELTVAAPWDRVGACLVKAYADDFQILYVPVPSEQRAELVTTVVITGPLSQAKHNLFSMDIKASGTGSIVTYRANDRQGSSIERTARSNVEQCGKT